MTTPSRTAYVLAAALFIAALAGVLILDLGGLFVTKARFPGERVSSDAFWSGDLAREVDGFLTDHSAVIGWLRPRYGRFTYQTLGSGNRAVVLGRDMIFDVRRVDLKSPEFWTARRTEAADTIQRLSDALREIGTTLVVAPVPDSIRIYPDQLPALGYGASAKATFYGDLMRDLKAKGVEAVDLEATFQAWRRENGESVKLLQRADHHWSAEGSRVGCDEIARTLTRLGFATGADLQLSRKVVVTKLVPSFVALAGWSPEDGTPAQYAEPKSMPEVVRPSGLAYEADASAPIVSASDSFGRYAVAGQLAMATGTEVAAIVNMARGPWLPIYSLLERIQSGYRPKAVVWVFEEIGLYAPAYPWSRQLMGELVPPGQRLTRFTPIDASSFELVRGGELVQSSPTWVSKSTQRAIEVRIPRAVGGPRFISLTMRVKSDSMESLAWASADDEATTPRGLKSKARDRIQLNDLPRSDVWREVRLPVPPGTSPIILSLQSDLLGLQYEVCSAAWVEYGNEVPVPTSQTGVLPASSFVDPLAALSSPSRQAKHPVQAGECNVGAVTFPCLKIVGSRQVSLRSTGSAVPTLGFGLGAGTTGRLSGRAFYDTPAGPEIVLSFDLSIQSDQIERFALTGPTRPATGLVLEVWSAEERPWNLLFLPD